MNTWIRTNFTSVMQTEFLELIVVQNAGSDESWSWTARGYREPDDDWGADRFGWVNTSTRKAAEEAAESFCSEKE